MKMRFIAILVVGLFCALGIETVLAQGGVSLTQTTEHYKIMLDIGPLATMLMPDQAQNAKQGEVMVQMQGMPMPEMSMTDQGQPVNHHLEAHIVDLATNQVVTDTLPTISITDGSGMARTLMQVAMMYDVQVGASDTHFGNNVYLPDGSYTIVVTVKSDTATFKDVAVSAAASGTAAGTPTAMAMAETPTTEATTMVMAETPTTEAAASAATPTAPAPTAASTPATLPVTGEASPGNALLWAVAGLVLAGLGLLVYRIARANP